MLTHPLQHSEPYPSDLDLILAEVVAELQEATKRHGAFPTRFHGLAVIEEEMDEFKDEVRHGTLDRQRAECVQVAAMAIRYLMDIK